MLRPLAIIPCFNEIDILPWVLHHLHHQGCSTYVLDNWSTDGSEHHASERWPAQGPTDVYNWTGMLERVSEIAMEQSPEPRWVMLHDADEIRRAHESHLTLAEGFRRAELAGFNAVGFEAVTYVPVDNLYRGFPHVGQWPEKHFRYFRTDHIDQRTPHVKAWLQRPGASVDLATHGGHEARFYGRNTFHKPFLLKHYPIRSQQHGERKVLQQRLPRFSQAELQKNWHVQYDEYRGSEPSFLGRPEDLSSDLTAYLGRVA